MADVEYFYAREDCHDVLYEVPRDLLRIFGRKFGMVDSRHPENMSQLLDTARPAKRHLNGIQPFRKVVWIKPWTRSIEVFEHHQPRAAPAPDFYDDFIRRLNAETNGKKANISEKQKQSFGKFLNGTYCPAGKEKGPAGQYRQWELVFGMSVQKAKTLMEFRPATIWTLDCAQVCCKCTRRRGRTRDQSPRDLVSSSDSC